jgi:hypothetical protein
MRHAPATVPAVILALLTPTGSGADADGRDVRPALHP